MATSAEGQITNRPPLFDGNNYSHWKDKMTLYLQATDYALWIIVPYGLLSLKVQKFLPN